MDKRFYKFGMDWLNGVLPVTDVSEVFKMLEVFSGRLRFERWQLVNSGKYNYSRRYCLDGGAMIQLMYNPVSDEQCMTACEPDEWVNGVPVLAEKKEGIHHNPYVFFSISGDGIRYLNSLGGEVSALNKLLFYFYRHGFKTSRFDVYCDILDCNNAIVQCITEAFSYARCEQVGKPFIKTNFRRTNNNFKQYSLVDENGTKWYNSQLGNHGSNMGMFRCYNKLLEMTDGRLADISEEVFKDYDVSDYWYRLEYEVHKDYAAQCFNSLMQNAENCNSPLCFEDIFYSVFCRFFSISIANTAWQLVDGSAKCSTVWNEFSEELCNSKEYFV